MATYHIKKPFVIPLSNISDVYFTGGNEWSNVYADRKTYTSKASAESAVNNSDGKNGGFDKASVVKES